MSGLVHKAFECRMSQDDRQSRLVCYSCNQVGHRSTECPNKPDKSSQFSSVKNNDQTNVKKLGVKVGSAPKIANWVAVGSDFRLVKGKVNGLDCPIAPDTGAEVTIVPGTLVYESQMLPDTVVVRGATGIPVTLCMADVQFEIEGISSVRRVAVARADMLCDKVLFSVPMDDSMARKLLLGAVETPNIGVEAGHSGDTPDTQISTSVDAVVALSGKEVGGETSKITLEQTEEQASVNVVTRAGRWMESLAAETAAQRDRDTVPPVPLESIDEVMSEVQVEEDEVAEVARDVAEVDDSSGSAEAEMQCSFGSPSLVDDPDVEKLKVEMVANDSLGHCRDLADTKKMGYSWGGGLLYHTIVDDGDSEKKRLVLPKSRRAKVLELAHDRTGHVGIKKMRALINSRFVWPGIGKDVTNFVQSCNMCARMNKSGNRQAQLVERPIVTEPFESVAVDIIGPLPKAKGGVRCGLWQLP